MLGTTLPTPLYPEYMRTFGWTPPLVTVVFAAYALAVIAGLLFFGPQSDRLGRRPVLFAGLLLSALSAAAFLAAHGLAPVLAGRILSGLSAGVFTGAGTAAMVDRAPANARRVYTLYAVIVNLGGLGAGTLISGAAAQFFPHPLRTPYAIDLALLAPAFLCIGAAPESVPRSGRFTLAIQRLRVPAAVRASFWQAAAVGICTFAVAGVFSAVAPAFLSARLHVHAPLVTGALVFVLMELSALGQSVVERIPKGQAFNAGCSATLAGLALLAAAIGWHSEASLFLAAGVGGFGQGVVMGFGLANINERIAERRGEVTSAYFVLIYAGLALPVVAVGFLSVPLGLQIAGLLFCALTAAVVTGAMIASTRLRGSGESMQ